MRNRNLALARSTAQLLPPEPVKLTVDAEQIAKIVKEQVTAILADRGDLILRPFFDTHNLAAELRRLQKMPARRKWSVYFEQFGCLICKTKDAYHAGCGMCPACYGRTGTRLRVIVGEPSPSHRALRYTRDLESVARKALLEAVESFTPSAKGSQ